MRNIALLEWGPASLFYIQPRECIKVRTPWLKGGPQMPPFLSSMEDAKANASDFLVRYALSAFEDLNSAIKNLRRCFGFPYAEYIGFLNTLTRASRARREHEPLVDRLRRWAMFNNVDAVIWIDYSKSNQPPGSFKMGPQDSRPFSASHTELCTHVPGGIVGDEGDGDESEEVMSEIDEEQGGGGVYSSSLPAGAGAGGAGGHQHAELSNAKKGTGDQHENSRRPSRTDIAGSTGLCGRSVLRTFHASRRERSQRPLAKARSPRAQKEERPMLSTTLQEEIVPVHGSIYQRSIAPGPGYYGHGSAAGAAQDIGGPSFGHKQKNDIDQLAALSEELPGPGEYRAKQALTEAKSKLGCFGRAAKMVSSMDAARKLPFISAAASASEGYGVQTPNAFQSVNPGSPSQPVSFAYAPKYSFGKSRRPW